MFTSTSAKVLTLPFIMVVLTDKLIEYRPQKQMVKWTENCQKYQVQRVVVRGTKSIWRTVTSDILQGSANSFTIWEMGHIAPSAYLQMIQNWKE